MANRQTCEEASRERGNQELEGQWNWKNGLGERDVRDVILEQREESLELAAGALSYPRTRLRLR